MVFQGDHGRDSRETRQASPAGSRGRPRGSASVVAAYGRLWRASAAIVDDRAMPQWRALLARGRMQPLQDPREPAARRHPRETPIWKLEVALKCRSCKKGRYAPPVHMIRLTEKRGDHAVYSTSGPWDVVIFSGDLTQSGARDEFDKLDEILQELWAQFAALGCSPKLIVLPGNHDISRPAQLKAELRLMKRWWSEAEGFICAFKSCHRVIWEKGRDFYEERKQQITEGTVLVASRPSRCNPARIHKLDFETGNAELCKTSIVADGTNAQGFQSNAITEFDKLREGNDDRGVQLDVWAARCVENAATAHPRGIGFPVDVIIVRSFENIAIAAHRRLISPAIPASSLFCVP
jgi:hypothetical protein